MHEYRTCWTIGVTHQDPAIASGEASVAGRFAFANHGSEEKQTKKAPPTHLQYKNYYFSQ